MKTKRKEKPVRITVDMPPALHKRLEKLEHTVGASSKADVIRDSLRVYEFIIEQMDAGYRLCVAKGDELQPVMIVRS